MFLHWAIFNHPLFIDPTTRSTHGEQILRESILAIDEAWAKLAEQESMSSGTTAVMALLVGSELFVANVGDSRAVLCRNRQALELSSIHSPSQDSEKARISNAGGCVVFFNGWRVNGQYAVSRSIGDYPVRNLLIADPHTMQLTITPSDEFLILASDGLWDVFTPAEAVDMVLNWLKEFLLGSTTTDISQILFDEATSRASKDNITIIVLIFRERKILKSKSSFSI